MAISEREYRAGIAEAIKNLRQPMRARQEELGREVTWFPIAWMNDMMASPPIDRCLPDRQSVEDFWRAQLAMVDNDVLEPILPDFIEQLEALEQRKRSC